MRALSGKVDAWDIPLVLPMWEKNKFCVQPPRNLVANMGVDEHSTHTTSATWPLLNKVEPLNIQVTPYEICPPMQIEKLDKLLTHKFYKIRFYHGLLPVYGPIKDFLTPKKYEKTLQDRILDVQIPKKRTPAHER